MYSMYSIYIQYVQYILYMCGYKWVARSKAANEYSKHKRPTRLADVSIGMQTKDLRVRDLRQALDVLDIALIFTLKEERMELER